MMRREKFFHGVLLVSDFDDGEAQNAVNDEIACPVAMPGPILPGLSACDAVALC